MTYPRPMKLLAPLLAAVLVASLAACSPGTGTPTEAGEDALAEEEDGRGKKGGKDAEGAGRKKQGGKRKQGEVAGDGEAGGGGAGGGGRGGAIDPALRTASSIVREPEPNAETGGAPPPYTELVAAAIEGLGDDFRITLRFAGNIPDRMPDENTFMVVAIGFKGRRDNQRYGFGAQATEDGWNAYAGGENRAARRFPGTFRIAGPEIQMTIPWRFIRGPYRFTWQANSSWFRSVAGTSHYAFDPIPTDGEARFPGS